MRKQIIALLLTAAMALSAAGCAGGSSTGREYTAEHPLKIVYAEVNSAESLMGKVAAAFKAKVEELSGGSIVVDVMYNGVLGSENDILDGMTAGSGAVTIARISSSALNAYGARKSVLLSLPYTFESRDHFWKFASSDLARDFLDESYTEGLGVKGLFYGEEGFRNFFSVHAVNDAGDLAGCKIRVSTDPIMTGLVEGLGATPTVISFGELYSSIQSGIVDGAEQPIAGYATNSFYEVAKNLILDGHTLGVVEIIVSSDFWDSLTPAQQDILTQAGVYAQEQNRAMVQASEDELMTELADKGCNIVQVEDFEPWRAAAAGVIQSYTAGYEDLYKQILDMGEN